MQLQRVYVPVYLYRAHMYIPLMYLSLTYVYIYICIQREVIKVLP